MSKTANLILRIGVAFAFLYPPIDALVDPNSWVGYLPHYVRTFGIPDLVLLHGFGLIEVVLAVWLLWGRKVWWPASAAALILCLIVLSDLADFQVVFRDLAIAAGAAALAIDARRKN